MKTVRGLILLIAGVLLIWSVTGCAGFYGRTKNRYTSSVVEYLYPKKDIVEVPTIPQLSLPLRVGVAFVPEAGAGPSGSMLSEKEKIDLMDRISSEFQKLAFLKYIEVIPSAYLTKEGGFTNLDQIRAMFGIDIIVLLSYDQVQHTDEGMMSLSYWTIVGAYVIKGEKNDTNTMIDAAVYDIPSRKMLFRAPGLSHIQGSATLVNLKEQLRVDSSNGFRSAADNLVTNLQDQLDRFKTKLKESPQEYVVEHKPGYTGAGSMEGAFTALLLSLGGMALWRNRKR